ncbi:hypothetical protein BRADI_2g32908v3 [Brachypodium distachyon]|uniref:Uncharacterized protein n=1 Tax=Brachypodium distachyon TaxID=15368 RepID=A0A2K2DBI1_BRADI|nr:hypothetical protein BRADI_2g32908v3 [Brachypodium distachyon]
MATGHAAADTDGWAPGLLFIHSIDPNPAGLNGTGLCVLPHLVARPASWLLCPVGNRRSQFVNRSADVHQVHMDGTESGWCLHDRSSMCVEKTDRQEFHGAYTNARHGTRVFSAALK